MSTSTSHVDRIARIKITLDHVRPPTWRRVEVPLTMHLKGIHYVIQAVMLFENYHLFDFHVEVDGQVRRYGIPDPDGFVEISDAKNIKLGTLLHRGATNLTYCYDFGDNWEHHLAIEAISDADPSVEYPRFIDGKRRAPPEDVGGIPGFEHFLSAMSDKEHPENGRMTEWYGSDFDSEDIEVETITTRMNKLANRRTRGKQGFEMSKGIRY